MPLSEMMPWLGLFLITSTTVGFTVSLTKFYLNYKFQLRKKLATHVRIKMPENRIFHFLIIAVLQLSSILLLCIPIFRIIDNNSNIAAMFYGAIVGFSTAIFEYKFEKKTMKVEEV